MIHLFWTFFPQSTTSSESRSNFIYGFFLCSYVIIIVYLICKQIFPFPNTHTHTHSLILIHTQLDGNFCKFLKSELDTQILSERHWRRRPFAHWFILISFHDDLGKVLWPRARKSAAIFGCHKLKQETKIAKFVFIPNAKSVKSVQMLKC